MEADNQIALLLKQTKESKKKGAVRQKSTTTKSTGKEQPKAIKSVQVSSDGSLSSDDSISSELRSKGAEGSKQKKALPLKQPTSFDSLSSDEFFSFDDNGLNDLLSKSSEEPPKKKALPVKKDDKGKKDLQSQCSEE
jgi:hypothetical protein